MNSRLAIALAMSSTVLSSTMLSPTMVEITPTDAMSIVVQPAQKN